MKVFHKYVTCVIHGHMSTSTVMTWMCDRCYSAFTPKHSEYVSTDDGDVKVSTSR
jgi:hypothetical protein